ncbi:MAG: 2TM domain-containing protein [Acidimicrobiales bacterium]
MEEQERRDAAIKRLKAKRDFRSHVVAYVVVNAFLIGVWALSSPRGYFWPVWVLGGWGIGLATHAWSVYGEKPITEDDVQREIDKGGGDVVG